MVGRNFFLGLASAFGFAMVLFGAPQAANAQCCAPPPPCCQPPAPPPAPPPCCRPPSPPPVTPACCTPGHNVNIPGVNVNVGAAIIVNTQVNAQASASSRASGDVIVYGGGGGGGGGWVAPQGAVVSGLNVEGGGVRRVAYQATRTRVRRVVIQAFCFDDRNTPHAASQVRPDREIGEGYEGELYRCIAGTHMQVTIANYEGRVDFAGGETLTCRRGESLWYSRRSGAHGEHGETVTGGSVECRPQRPARDCNERSLLRRYGAGIKILTMVRVETYEAFREESYRSTTSSSAAFSMDGGVGGIAY